MTTAKRFERFRFLALVAAQMAWLAFLGWLAFR
jgi:hypothetical protein